MIFHKRRFFLTHTIRGCLNKHIETASCINVFRLFRRAEQTTTRFAVVQQMLYIVNALRVECEEWRVELMAGHPRPFRSAQFEGFDALDKPHCHLDFLFCHLDRSGEIPRLALGMTRKVG